MKGERINCIFCGNEIIKKSRVHKYCSSDCCTDDSVRKYALRKGRKPAGIPKRFTQQHIISTVFNLFWIHNMKMNDIVDIVGLSYPTLRNYLDKWQERWDYHLTHRDKVELPKTSDSAYRKYDGNYYFDLLLRGFYDDKAERE